MVVFDTADLDSAVDGVVDAAWFNQGQVISCTRSDQNILKPSVYFK